MGRVTLFAAMFALLVTADALAASLTINRDARGRVRTATYVPGRGLVGSGGVRTNILSVAEGSRGPRTFRIIDRNLPETSPISLRGSAASLCLTTQFFLGGQQVNCEMPRGSDVFDVFTLTVDTRGTSSESFNIIEVKRSFLGLASVKGGPGRELFYGSPLNGDEVNGGAGRDILLGRGGGDELSGGVDEDIIEGGPGGDQLFGGSGGDIVVGGNGRDEIRGGAGNDKLERYIHSGLDDFSLPSGEELSGPADYAAVGYDKIAGDDGDDTVSYEQDSRGTTGVTGTVTDGVGTVDGDTLKTIEYLIGSERGDHLTVQGLLGLDTQAGDDVITIRNSFDDQYTECGGGNDQVSADDLRDDANVYHCEHVDRPTFRPAPIIPTAPGTIPIADPFPT